MAGLIIRARESESITTTVITAGDELTMLNEIKNSPEVFGNRLKTGDKFAIVVCVDGVPAGYAWGDLAAVHIEERFGFHIPVNPDEVYYFDSFIKPEYRGKGLLNNLLCAFVDYAQDRKQRKHITAIIEKENKRSVAVHEAKGYLRHSLHLAGNCANKKIRYCIKNYC
ncbi:GNAT family N-acetyltransferase [Marinobacter sp. X15-166B]|uniref:GNAT family N-acetyltransferase n=1 Tax=Marinobacter sp. X15-166B TaxID=1897620 RepID=UPI00085CBFE1|nr:GNAT family N-acetyltransferase [Marinobacter sp. X15-166B]OEY67753.1 hypothetical protein BG841_15835 [Marinobacter sp. X15-166B]